MHPPPRTDAVRLRILIICDVAICLVAALFIVSVHLFVADSPYLVLLAVLVAVAGSVMALGLVPLQRGSVRAATAWLAAANWSIAIVAAAVAVFTWPLMLLTALLPSVIAAAFVTGRELGTYVALSMVASLAVVLVGLLQDFSGLTDDMPENVDRAVLIFFTPLLCGMVALVVWQNSVRLHTALDAAIDAQRAIAEQAEALRRSRARVVAATDRERRRIERDLHDGSQQRLIALGIGLSRAKALCRSDPDAVVDALDALRHELHVTHDELRDLAQGVYPPVLSQHGLGEALRSAADRCALDVTLVLDDVGRHHPDVEAAIYFCCVEALQNAAKHSRAGGVTVSIGVDDTGLWFTVDDDGIGFDQSAWPRGSGVVNMHDRLGAMGGDLVVTSAPRRGTHVRGHIPRTPEHPRRTSSATYSVDEAEP